MFGSRFLKISIIAFFCTFAIISCSNSNLNSKPPLKVADDRSYTASLFRQNCAICHGFEGEGKDLGGRRSANLRYSLKTEEEMAQAIYNGGNGMVPFRNQLSEKDIRSLAKYVKEEMHNDQ